MIEHAAPAPVEAQGRALSIERESRVQQFASFILRRRQCSRMSWRSVPGRLAAPCGTPASSWRTALWSWWIGRELTRATL
jgi:hypothetical protein